MPVTPTTHLEQTIAGEVSPVTHLEQVIVEYGGGGGGGGGVAGVSSFNGRRNAVRPMAGDYDATMIPVPGTSKNVKERLDEIAEANVVDGELSQTSQNPVENRVIARRIRSIESKVLPSGGRSGDLLSKSSNSDYAAAWVSGDNLMKKTDYDLNNDGKVDKAETADALKGPTYKGLLRNTSADTYVLTDEDKGVRNGVVPLDSNRKILPEFLPDSIMAGLTYGGIFNATTRVVRLTPAAKSILGVSTDTMTLQNSSTVPEGYPANAELFYITTVAGDFAGMDFSMGDWLISLGTEWQHLQNGDQVSSVLGKTGAVTFNSDDVDEGTQNLYMTPAERAKLRDIEAEATKDTDVVQTAAVVVNDDGQNVLRLTNKNGTVTEFVGSGDIDLDEFLKKTGNASNVYAPYSYSGTRQAFTGNERAAAFFGKVASWLRLIEDVAWSGSYLDLQDAPTRTSQFINDGNGTANQPFITRTENNLLNYYLKSQLYTRDEVDALLDAISSFNFIEVEELPTTDIQTNAIYYVPAAGGTGYDRYQRISNRWVYLGSTDVDMSEYLKKDGNGSTVTTAFTAAAERVYLNSGETLAASMGKIDRYMRDLQAVAFENSYTALEDADELALKTDLEDYVAIQQDVADAGMVLGIGEDGKVAPVDGGGNPVVKKGGGNYSIVGNSLDGNVASAAYSTAFGQGTGAINQNMFACGRYNLSDPGLLFAVGNGVQGSRSNAFSVDTSGNAYALKEVFAGNTTDNIVEPSGSNSLTTKRYVDRAIDEGIANAGLLRSMVVATVPSVDEADGNTLYLVADPTSEGHYLQYKKVLVSTNPDVYEIANLGGTQIEMEGSQVTTLPTPSAVFADKVYQYVGSSSAYKFGAFYTCKNQSYYCWLQTATGNKYYTKSATPSRYDRIYSAIGETLVWWVESVSGVTLTDSAGNTYTRLTTDDKSQYEWQAINDKTSDFENNGNGTGNPSDRFITLEETESRYKYTSDGTITAGDSETMSQVNLSTKKVKSITFLNLWNYIKGKITGAISGIITSNLTANRALISNGSGKVAVSGTTWTELNYLQGATSSIQTQLNAKQNKAWTYVGILGASRGSSITVGDDWDELDLIMRVTEGSSLYNISQQKTKNDFTTGSPTGNNTFVGFYWGASFSCARRIGLSGTGTSRKLNVNWDAENGWALQGIYVYKR